MVTWLRTYLDMSPERATWTYVADALIAHHTPKTYENIDDFSKINIFLQSWNTDSRKLPKDLQDMITVAKRHGLRLDGLAFSRNIIRQMPIWLHSESKEIKRQHNNNVCKCLRKNHDVKTVGDAEKIAKLTHTTRHTNRRNCACTSCRNIRQNTGCTHPNRCYDKAQELLNLLPAKWNPNSRLPEDYEPEELDPAGYRDGKTFDWRITTKGNLANAFRIFTNREKNTSLPDTERTQINIGPTIEAYTDGSCIHNGTNDAIAGAGVYFPNEEYSHRAIKLPEYVKQSNQSGEIIGIKEAVETVDEEREL
ncbi:uncharacterized protein C8R40DRAFT_1036448, partial [Lentinula edodes]|uniref:uncharacterized protein n=1 Tax=Lentinula edodes TaxID=5353 RepID=UPI001E8EA628